MTKCVNCGKDTPEPYLNYCDWGCHVEAAKKGGGKVIAPNGLPITVIRGDNLMLEHESADHPDYKFPVTAVFYQTPQEMFDKGESFWVDGNSDKVPMTIKDLEYYHKQEHALIYTDGSVAITLYECCYAMWYLRDGKFGGGSLWDIGQWTLEPESVEKIKELAREQRRRQRS